MIEKWLLAALLAVGVVTPTYATEGELWLDFNFRSYHVQDTSKYNDRNYGFSLEYHFTNTLIGQVGYYENSLRVQSKYLGVSYLPFKLGDSLSFGGFAGLVTGYNKKNQDEFQPAAGLASSFEYRINGVGVGTNILFVPKASSNPAVFGMQLKVGTKIFE